jgi:hypothetical protein
MWEDITGETARGRFMVSSEQRIIFQQRQRFLAIIFARVASGTPRA